MTNIEALKEVYVALGGTATNFTAQTNDEAIHLISTVVAAAVGAELPKVTGSNNGQVLTVVQGKWAAADIPSQLPAVTTSDEGSVLKVNAEGKWDVGTDATE